MRRARLEDLKMYADVDIDYDYDPEEHIIELTRVEWFGVNILDKLSDNTYDEIVEYISEECLRDDE
jgi:hypothetical protein